MAIVPGVANKIKFRKALERDLPTDFIDFYYQAERYLRQKNVEAKRGEVNAVDDMDYPRLDMERIKEQERLKRALDDRSDKRGSQNSPRTSI